MRCARSGSSPRGRGKRRRGRVPSRRVRAHPRAGGENRGAYFGASGVPGSSPRGRGKLMLDDPGHVMRGLIPARAGKTHCGMLSPLSPPAHPRAGGENRAGVVLRAAGFGSSPRGRGKQDRGCGRVRRRGLIPARAGKTAGDVRALPAFGGSSPRGRGKRPCDLLEGVRVGLIPARAGKTRDGPGLVGHVEAHPRAGGENVAGFLDSGLCAGSSPRGRGKRVIDAMSCSMLGAHPRAGGENASRTVPSHP